MFEAVIFDMDGVIADSEPLHIRAERKTLAPFGLDIKDEEFQAYMGQTPRILLQGIIETYSLDTSVDELYPLHKMNLLELYKTSLQPIKGSVETIRNFNRKRIVLGLASSSDMELIDSVLDSFDLRSFFSAWVSGQQVEHIKPAPDIFLLAAKELGVTPRNCLVIEDSTAGIEAAEAADMTCIGFRSPNSSNQVYDQADFVADSFSEIDTNLLETLWEAKQLCSRQQ